MIPIDDDGIVVVMSMEDDAFVREVRQFQADVRADAERFQQQWREAQERWPAIEAEGDRIRRGLRPTSAVRETPAMFGDAPDDPLVRLERKLDGVAADVRQLKADVGQLKSDVETLKSDVAALKTDVAALKTDVAALKTDVAALKTDVAALKSDVAELKADVTELRDGQSRYVTKVEFEGLRSELRMVADGFAATQQRLDYVADLVLRYRVG